jgi:hypothetical protein
MSGEAESNFKGKKTGFKVSKGLQPALLELIMRRFQLKIRVKFWVVPHLRPAAMLLAVLGPVFWAWSQTANQKVLPDHVPAAIRRLTPAGQLPAEQRLHLAIGLPLRQASWLTNFLQQLYDPKSTNYHRYLTASQFTERFGPPAEDYQKVIDYMTANGLTVASTHDSRLVLDVRGKAADIERVFQVKLRTYQHPTEARIFYAPDGVPSVDGRVPMVDVAGLSDYASLHSASLRSAGAGGGCAGTGSGPNGNYLGYDFRSAYAPGVSLDGTGQIIGLFEAEGYYTNDILAYENLAGLPNVPVQNILVDSFSGVPGTNDSEAVLDIEMAISMAPGASVMVIECPTEIDEWVDALDIMASQTQIKQFSSSWGYDDGADPNAIMDAEFQKMAAQGQSFFQASGDGDAYTAAIAVPSDSPYVTSVGGSSLTMNSGTYASETAWNQGFLGTNRAWFGGGGGCWGSGGGVSLVYGIPSWQQSVSMVNNKGSATKRNIPDVALTAANVWVTCNNGSSESFIGTSCAAPLWAGFAALANQQAAAHGNPPVGFINPAIYALGQGKNYTNCFHDITIGNNTNGASTGKYYAAKGYDLCTGWGTPAGQALLNALSPVDSLGISPTTEWLSVGPMGGPFANSSATLTLTNTGSSSVNWACVNTSLWLSVTPTNGTLAARGAKAVVLSLKSAASNLPAGNYSADIWFTNSSDGFAQSRQSTLAVRPQATLGAFASALLSLAPVGYWRLDETNMPSAANVVTNYGSLGFIGNGLPFDGVIAGATGIVQHGYNFSNPGLIDHYHGSRVLVAPNTAFNPAGPFSVEFWAKPRQNVTNYACAAASIDMSQNGGASRMGWILYGGHTNHWLFRVGNTGGYVAQLTGGALQSNVWQHVAGVYDGANISLFVNGVCVAGPITAGGFTPNTNEDVPLGIGATSQSTYVFDGALDEMAFYTNALSSNTVFAHYRAATTNNAGYRNQILASQPVGYWCFDEPTNGSPATNTPPLAFNLGSLSYLCDGAYQPGSVPGLAGITNSSFGRANLACSFLADSYIDIPGTWLSFTGAVTLTAWIKTALYGQPQSVVSLGASLYRLNLDGSGYPHFGDSLPGDLAGPNPVNDNQWHQLAGMYDGLSALYLYVDGQLVAQYNGALV